MKDNELKELASMISARLQTGAIDDLAEPEESYQCFTCSGRFKCRPSFLIQTPASKLANPTDS